MAQYAFRCRTCGRLHEAVHAGDNQVPHACCVCGSGVLFTAGVASADHKETLSGLQTAHPDHEFQVVEYHPKSATIVHPQNWEVLADATDGRLAELGLKREDVSRHQTSEVSKTSKVSPPRSLSAEATEVMGIKDQATQ